MERPDERLCNEGVVLRRLREDDVEEVLRVVTESLEHLEPWMPWARNGYGRDQAVEFVQRYTAEWHSGESFQYAILSESGEFIGGCGLMARIGAGGLEIGYWLHPDHTGRGIVTRAVAALVDEAFRVGADRVEIVHDVANVRSRRVPERLGFTEVDRRPPQEPVASSEEETVVVWRRTSH